MQSNNKWGKLGLLLLGIVIGAGIGAYALIFSGYFPSGLFDRVFLNSSNVEINIDQPVPDIEIQSMSGDLVHINQMQGQPVLVNFWATWCIPCKLEMPIIQTYATQYSSELIVLPVNVDDELPEIQKFIDDLGLTMPVYLDPGGKAEKAFRVIGFPSTFIINRDGILKTRHVGVVSETQLQSYLLMVGVGN
jgi:thiol-disulfide isomerase/thioredoxin